MSSADSAGFERRTIEIGTPDGVMKGTVAVNPGPMRLTGLLKTAYALTNSLVQRANAVEEQAGRAISCRAGCGACCRHMVPVSIPEALAIVNVIDGLEHERRTVVLKRFGAAVSVFEQRQMIDRLLDPTLTNDPFLPISREYFELQIACPFLEDESCGIHEHRPVACRDYNVTSPAAWCAKPYDHEIAKVPMPLPLSVPLARTAAAVLGERPRLIPLTLVPRWASGHAELRDRGWPGLELFDLFLEQLGALYPVDDESVG